jgi:hypothetical protein
MASLYRCPAENGRPKEFCSPGRSARKLRDPAHFRRGASGAGFSLGRKICMRFMVALAFFIALPALGQELLHDPHSWVRAVRDRVFQEGTPNRNGSVRMECRIEELDGSGQIKKTLLLQHRRIYQNGTLREELLSATEDGKDVTERQRREEAGMDRHASRERWSLDDALAPSIPLLATPDGAYRLAFEKESAEGRLRISYSPREQKPTLRAARGFIVLDDKDHLPVRHRFEPIPMPDWIDKLVTDVRYTRIAGLVVPDSTDTRAEGGFLFVRKRYRIRMRYHDWSLESARGQEASP